MPYKSTSKSGHQRTDSSYSSNSSEFSQSLGSTEDDDRSIQTEVTLRKLHKFSVHSHHVLKVIQMNSPPAFFVLMVNVGCRVWTLLIPKIVVLMVEDRCLYNLQTLQLYSDVSYGVCKINIKWSLWNIVGHQTFCNYVYLLLFGFLQILPSGDGLLVPQKGRNRAAS